MDEQHVLTGRDLCLAYDKIDVSTDLSILIPPERITVIIGPNACGKSTLLRALARLLKPRSGVVYLDGKPIQQLPTREVAKQLGILPQSPIAPDGITVVDLVSRGRYPHQKWIRQWTEEDARAVTAAMTATQILDLAAREVDELSGGQRQRVWVAMALAQGTEIMLLDEPTTFLDLAHQIEVLDLLTDLNKELKRTIVLVLHDLNQAVRYADHLIAMKEGSVVSEGPAEEVVTAALVEEVFGVRCEVITHPATGSRLVVPIGRNGRVQGEVIQQKRSQALAERNTRP